MLVRLVVPVLLFLLHRHRTVYADKDTTVHLQDTSVNVHPRIDLDLLVFHLHHRLTGIFRRQAQLRGH
jgi:hypothetical protein